MNFRREGFYWERNHMNPFANNSRDEAIIYNSATSSSSPSQSQSQSLPHQHLLQIPGVGGVLHPMSTQSPADEETEEDRGRSGGLGVEKEHMFDKVVTPSDVGKLNRLVIPKQHAEKYFPLDSSSNMKGLLLNFEDRNGKSWRFRYSYWNSSQSYVMTKGWSRFVKDKRLEAGDIVSFERGLRESVKDLLFIDWKRRPTMADFPLHRFPLAVTPWQPLPSTIPNFTSNGLIVHGSTVFNYGNYPVKPINGGPVVYVDRPLGSTAATAGPQGSLVYDSVPVVHGKAAAKRLRLFGVNMDCPISYEDSDHHHPNDTSSSSSPSGANNYEALSHDDTLVPHTLQLSSSAHYQWPLHLSPYNGVPLSSTPRGFLSKGKSSSPSLDLEM